MVGHADSTLTQSDGGAARWLFCDPRSFFWFGKGGYGCGACFEKEVEGDEWYVNLFFLVVT